MQLPALMLLLAVGNALTLAVYGYDKAAARYGWRRVAEGTLLGLAACGGSIGALLGLWWLRHKTRKPRFAVGIPVLVAAHAALWWWGSQRGLW